MTELTNAVKKYIVKAGKIALEIKKSGIEIRKKHDHSIVTNADIEISNFIFEVLSKLSPALPIICEERNSFPLNIDNFWMVDPIDGTRSYAKGKTTYTINICLIEQGKPKLGFIYQPEIDKLYYTNAQGKLAIEQYGIAIDQSIARNNIIAAVSSHNLNVKTKDFLKSNEITDIISIPSSIKFCLVAEGTVDIYPRFDQIMEWDVAAGHALIKAAGGEVLDMNNQPLTYNKPDFKHPEFVAAGKKWIAKNLLKCQLAVI